MYYYYFDWYYFLLLPVMIFSIWAQVRVSSTFNKYQQQHNRRNITGAEAARRVLSASGVMGIGVEQVAGTLTDHYDPRSRVIRLSSAVYNSTSSAAVGVACHEAGHAVQHAENYGPLKLRMALIPVANFGSRLLLPLLLISFVGSIFMPSMYLVTDIVLIIFLVTTFLQFITLPVEFNASRRALRGIEGQGILYGEELEGAKKVLTAAALTYVAALAVSLMQLLRFIVLVNRRRD